MRKKLRIAVVICCAVVTVVIVGLGIAYWASQQVPPFYREALQADPVVQRRASDQMLQQTTALASDMRRQGRWEALFTAEQINGWLSVDLVENHPDALPAGLRDPRVAVAPDRLTVACRYLDGGVTTVLSLVVQPYVAEPNVLALRIRKARAGLLPMPLRNILDRVSEAADKAGYRVRWQQADGDPVVLISIGPPPDRHGKHIQLEGIRLGKGEVYLAGTTRLR